MLQLLLRRPLQTRESVCTWTRDVSFRARLSAAPANHATRQSHPSPRPEFRSALHRPDPFPSPACIAVLSPATDKDADSYLSGEPPPSILVGAAAPTASCFPARIRSPWHPVKLFSGAGSSLQPTTQRLTMLDGKRMKLLTPPVMFRAQIFQQLDQAILFVVDLQRGNITRQHIQVAHLSRSLPQLRQFAQQSLLIRVGIELPAPAWPPQTGEWPCARNEPFSASHVSAHALKTVSTCECLFEPCRSRTPYGYRYPILEWQSRVSSRLGDGRE